MTLPSYTDSQLKETWLADPQLEIIRELVFGGTLAEKDPFTARIEMRAIVANPSGWITSLHRQAMAQEIAQEKTPSPLPPNPLKHGYNRH